MIMWRLKPPARCWLKEHALALHMFQQEFGGIKYIYGTSLGNVGRGTYDLPLELCWESIWLDCGGHFGGCMQRTIFGRL